MDYVRMLNGIIYYCYRLGEAQPDMYGWDMNRMAIFLSQLEHRYFMEKYENG